MAEIYAVKLNWWFLFLPQLQDVILLLHHAHRRELALHCPQETSEPYGSLLLKGLSSLVCQIRAHADDCAPYRP